MLLHLLYGLLFLIDHVSSNTEIVNFSSVQKAPPNLPFTHHWCEIDDLLG